jgi:putative transposase
MSKSSPLRTGRHCTFNLHVHLVFVTKYPRDVFTEDAIRELSEIFATVCEAAKARLLGCDGGGDYVYLHVVYPPSIALSTLVNSLKGVSSRLIRQKQYPSIQQALSVSRSLWSPSYFAGSSAEPPLLKIEKYIEDQRRPG